MVNDPIVKEVRAARREIFKGCNSNIKDLFAYLRVLEKAPDAPLPAAGEAGPTPSRGRRPARPRRAVKKNNS